MDFIICFVSWPATAERVLLMWRSHLRHCNPSHSNRGQLDHRSLLPWESAADTRLHDLNEGTSPFPVSRGNHFFHGHFWPSVRAIQGRHCFHYSFAAFDGSYLKPVRNSCPNETVNRFLICETETGTQRQGPAAMELVCPGQDWVPSMKSSVALGQEGGKVIVASLGPDMA